MHYKQISAKILKHVHY